jgi:hypothetical protein
MRVGWSWLARAVRMRLNIYHGMTLLALVMLVVCLAIAPLTLMALLMALAVMLCLDEAERERRSLP